MRFQSKAVTHDQFLSAEELITLYQFMGAHEREPYWIERCATVRHVLGTGCRVSELINLVLSDEILPSPMNFCRSDGFLYLRKWKDTTGKHHVNRERIVKVIPEYLPHYQERWHRLRAEGCEVFFPNTLTGENIINKRILQRRWEETLRAAGICTWRNKYGIHCGRHTYATHELMSRPGMKPELMQYLLGHKHIEETLDTYTHAVLGVWTLYEDNGPKEPVWWQEALGKFRDKTAKPFERHLRIAK